MKSCDFKKCKICPIVNKDTTVVSYACLKRFGVIRPDDLTCLASNVIYAITCKKCGKQYVGETMRTLRRRIMEHLNDVSKNTKNSYLVGHFNDGLHGISDIEVTIIEKLPDNTSTAQRREKEDFWIRTLNSAFPFGFNDKIDGYGLISKGMTPLNHKNSPYFSIKLPAKKKSRGKRKRTNRIISLLKISETEKFYFDDAVETRVLFQSLQKMSKRNLNALFNKVKSMDQVATDANRLCLEAVFRAKFQRPTLYVRPKPKMFVAANFCNKGMEKIRLHTVFKDRRIRQLTMVPESELGDIIITYKNEPTTGSRFLNHCKELRKLDLDVLDSTLNWLCDCHSSVLCYQPAGHIVCGDLQLVTNATLKQLFSYGTNYRIPCPMDWDAVKASAVETVEEAVMKISQKFKIEPSKLEEFESKCCEIIEKRIAFFVKHFHTEGHKCFKETDLKAAFRELRYLQQKFIIAPADKAANNYIFICKKYYFQVMCKEMGLENYNGQWTASGNATYKAITSVSVDEIIGRHQRISRSYGVKFTDEDKCLPLMFAIPKLHKVPYKFRFIAGASKASCKPLSLLLTKILTHMKSHFQSYCSVTEGRRGTPAYWSIDSSLGAKENLCRIRNVKCITSADFSTLYTSLPHSIILREMGYLIEKLFKNEGKRYLCIGYKNSFYSNEIVDRCNCLVKEDILALVEYVLQNTFVKFAEYMFQQVSGIPMGGNASPLLADLTLSVLEFKFLQSTTPALRYRMKHTFRYIDDICNLNDPEFLDHCKQIYPACLPLEDTTSADSYTNYLDLAICIRTGTALCSLYNKTDAFNFTVIRMPEFSSNVHSNIGYNTFYSQLIRIARICDCAADFQDRCMDLCDIFIHKGYSVDKLLCILKKFALNYTSQTIKFGFSSYGQFIKIAHKWVAI